MDIKIISENYNPAIKRKEILFQAKHKSASTPQRFELRQKLAAAVNSKLESTFIIKAETKTGTNETMGEAHVYDTPEKAKLIVQKHIWIRNLSPEDRAKIAETKTAKVEKKPSEKAPAKAAKEEPKKKPEEKKA
ncbi:MAG TPA: 30S ribosomal protein S24e [archaeon]|nr:30S ribosomal protein S24e [archaeon]